MNKAKVKGYFNKAATGGEVQVGVTNIIPNINQFCHRSSLKIRMAHGHLPGKGLFSGLGIMSYLQAPVIHE